jgi:metallo-beta-lactamase family protein
VKARIYTINGFSAHADRKTLLEYAKEARPQTLFIVHGELHAAESLAETLKESLPHTKIHIPELGQSFQL